VVVGLPLRVDHRLFNCAVVVAGGRVLGVVPKTYLPNYGEFYEARQFSAADARCPVTLLQGQRVPFGADLLFEPTPAAAPLPRGDLRRRVGADSAVEFAALAGATVLVNLSASNIVVGKSDYRHRLVSQQSARCLAAYLYSSAGIGESTTDLAWDGQALICENGDLLAESERFSNARTLIFADVDLERSRANACARPASAQSVRRHAGELAAGAGRRVRAGAAPASRRWRAAPHVERFPYVPADAPRRDERCHEVFNIQVQALVQRLEVQRHHKVVIGVSGGLDSTHALLVCARRWTAWAAAQQHPGLHHAGLRDQRAHPAQARG
jgi:NAD+ synthase (glutamine-hydrolysing)